MAASFVQTSFLGGAWSEYAQGRFDHPKYRESMAVCVNGFPLTTGAWVRRPGTQTAAFTRGGAAAAMLPFSFEDNSPYNVELTDGFMRFFQGLDLIKDQGEVQVTSISLVRPAVVTIAVAVDWTTGDQVLFTALDAPTIVALNVLLRRPFIVTMVDTLNFTINDALTGDAFDGTTVTWDGAFAITVNRISEIVSPYDETQIADVRGVQNETDMVLLHRDVFPQLLEADPPADGTPAVFTIEDADFVDGPYLDPVEFGILTPGGLTGLVDVTLSAAAYSSTTAYSIGDFALSSSVTYRSLTDQNVGNTPASNPTDWATDSAASLINNGEGFTPADLGRHIRLFSEPPLWAHGSSYTTGAVVKFAGTYWAALKDMTGDSPGSGHVSPNQPGVNTDTWVIGPSLARWTWGKIVDFPDSDLISQSLAGSGRIGNFDSSQSSHAFDGVKSAKVGSGTADRVQDVALPESYIGRSFASGLAVSSTIIYPSSNDGLNLLGGSSGTLKLRASNSAPASASDGTLLGSKSFNSKTQKSPLTISSNDQTTTWKYVWIDCTNIPAEAYGLLGLYHRKSISFAEIEFYGVTSPGGTTATVQLLGDPLLYSTTIVTWRLGLFNTRDDYPTCGCYHEGRLWLAGGVPNRFDASVSNDILNFAPTNEDGSVSDDRAISYTFNASDLNRIVWMIPDPQGIVAGTIGGEWLIDAPSSQIAGFAPANIRARRVTKYGCAEIEPKRTGLTTVFVQRYRRQLNEFLADAYSGKFVGPEMSELNRKAVAPGVAQLAYQASQVPIIWSRLDDGTLSGATYRRTSMISTQPPDMLGWHQHVLGSDREVIDISSGPAADGTLDALTLITEDATTGYHQVEVLSRVLEEEDDNLDAQYVDAGLVPLLGQTDSGNLRLYGLWPLNGQTVTVWAAALDCGDFTVTDGYVDVPLTKPFTLDWFTQLRPFDSDLATPVLDGTTSYSIPAVVGFTYTSQGQLLRPIAQDQTGAQLGPAFGKFKRTDHVGVQLVLSRGVSFGTDFTTTSLKPAILQTDGGRVLEPYELYSGVYRATLVDGYSFDSQLCWQVSRPYPLTITALGGYLASQN